MRQFTKLVGAILLTTAIMSTMAFAENGNNGEPSDSRNGGPGRRGNGYGYEPPAAPADSGWDNPRAEYGASPGGWGDRGMAGGDNIDSGNW